MLKATYTGNIDEIKKTVYNMVEESMKLDAHDLFLTRAHTTAFVKNGRKLHTLSEFDELNDFISSNGRQCFENSKIVMAWANVYPTGSYIRPHKHITFDNLISAVFYLQGNGVLHVGEHTYSLEQGETLFFPSNVEHWSEPNKNEQDRVMIGYDLYHGDKTDKEIEIIIKGFEEFIKHGVIK